MSIVLNGVAKVLDFGGQAVNGVALLPLNLGFVVNMAMDSITGVAGTALSCLTGGKVERFNETAKYTRSASLILPAMFKTVIGCFNEEAFDFKDKRFPDLGFCRTKFDLFDEAREYQKAQNTKNSNSTFLKKHIATRSYYFMAAIVAVISRIADFILGIGATLGAFACLGQWDKANEFAAKNLTVLGIIDDLSRGLRGVINPRQFKRKVGNLFSSD